MKYLIYAPDTHLEANKIQKELRETENIASRRNPDFYCGEFEKCDGVYVVRDERGEEISEVYRRNKVMVFYFDDLVEENTPPVQISLSAEEEAQKENSFTIPELPKVVRPVHRFSVKTQTKAKNSSAAKSK